MKKQLIKLKKYWYRGEVCSNIKQTNSDRCYATADSENNNREFIKYLQRYSGEQP